MDEHQTQRKTWIQNSTIFVRLPFSLQINYSYIPGKSKNKQEAQGPQFAHLPIVLMENC